MLLADAAQPAASWSRPDGYPDFETAHSGLKIERFAEALETRRIGNLVS
jgi:hypothetical protein